jgi:hypothetical protein
MDHSEYREEIPHGDHPVNYDHSEPGYKAIALYMGATIVFLGLIGVAIQNYYDLTYNADEYDRVLSQDNWTLRDLRNKEAWELTHYAYVEKEKGTVRIPIDEAMQLLIRDSSENKLKYPTNPAPVKTPEQLAAAAAPAGSPQGGAAANAPQNQGTQSSPNVQPPAPEHK